MIKIRIGIVTFNNSQNQLKRLLESISTSAALLRKNIALDLSITGIDNGAPCFEQAANSASLILPINITTVPTSGNIGFGKAMNLLMLQAFAPPDESIAKVETALELFIAVNPDGLFHRQCLGELIAAAATFKDALLEARQFPEEHPKPYSIATGETPWATGACLAIPRKMYETIGGFDENLFLYGEDVDLSWRAQAAGFAIKLVHDAIFVHPTLGRVWSKEAKKHFFLSAVYLAAKWHAEDFQRLYEEQFRSRFDQSQDIELLNTVINAAKKASTNIVNTTGFKPFFDEGKSFSVARWSY
ncbi:MAG: glycosyltransferase [Candidatus Obscuribacterales bacterium]|nr:glycosyltransferase [Candidatus Obscuribacterales bacterium]